MVHMVNIRRKPSLRCSRWPVPISGLWRLSVVGCLEKMESNSRGYTAGWSALSASPRRSRSPSLGRRESGHFPCSPWSSSYPERRWDSAGPNFCPRRCRTMESTN